MCSPFFHALLILLMGALGSQVASAQICTSAPPGLVGWFRGEGDATDGAGAGPNGTIAGTVAYAAGQAGQAFSFNGGFGNYVQIAGATNLDFNGTTPMTVELWAYRTGSGTTMHLLGKRASSCGAIQYQLAFSPGNELTFSAGSASVPTGVALPINSWTHLAVTFDGSNFVFYINGVSSGNGTGSLGASDGLPVTIGTVSTTCPPFAGLLDEVSFYNRALTASEVLGIYNAGSGGKCPVKPLITTQPQNQSAPVGTNVTFTVAATGTPPLSYQWYFGVNTLTNATNASLVLTNIQTTNGGNYSVVVTNAAGSAPSSNGFLTVITCSSPSAGLVSWWPGEGNAADIAGTNSGVLQNGAGFAIGEVGQAFNLDGSSQYVDVPNNASLNPTASISLEAWIYPTQFPSVSGPIIKKAGEGLGQNDGYAMELSGSSGVVFGAYLNGGVGWATSVSAPVGFESVEPCRRCL